MITFPLFNNFNNQQELKIKFIYGIINKKKNVCNLHLKNLDTSQD